MFGDLWNLIGQGRAGRDLQGLPTTGLSRFGLESLEDRTTPAVFNPTTVTELINDINIANGNGQVDTIDLGGGTFTLMAIDNVTNGNNGLPVILPDGGNALSIINGTIERSFNSGVDFRLLNVVVGADLTLDLVTLQGGQALGVAAGAVGGAILTEGNVSILRSMITNNDALDSGGGIFNIELGVLTIENSAIAANQATGIVGQGGAITNLGDLSLQNSTISGNSSSTQGGGLVNRVGALLEIVNSTIAYNSSAQGGGIFNYSGATITTLASTIVAGNVTAAENSPDFENLGTLVAATNNLIQSDDGNGLQNGVDGNIVGSSAGLDPALQNNGGPTPTHALLTGSAAINAGANPLSLANDQRGDGFLREVNGQADIGAFELQAEDECNGSTDENFVENLYRDLLGRDPDPVGFESWIALMAGGASRAEVVESFLNSEEYLTLQVTELYFDLLNRAPDAEGLTGWVNLVLDGNRLEDVANGILASPEYASLHPGADAFVASLYLNLLGRQPSVHELASWTFADLPNQVIIDSFFDSAEYITRTVNQLYIEFQNRPADPAGLSHFSEEVIHGCLSLEDVQVSILTSDEYYEQCATAGVAGSASV